MATKKKAAAATGAIDIKAPDYRVAEFVIVGTAPYVMNKFAQEALAQMREGMVNPGNKAKKKANREPKDFEGDYRGSMHVSDEGWHGIPATALKSSIVRACTDVGIQMTQAKRCIFVEQDGFSDDSVTPLVRIVKGEPEYFESYVRNANGGPDIRARARVPSGWAAVVRIRFDADVFTPRTIASLLMRAGVSVGIGAGRPASTMSCGMGWGTFRIGDAADIGGELAAE